MARRKSIIPGMSFSWKRALGITGTKQSFARRTGIPTTKQGMQRKVGASLLNLLFSFLGGGKKR
jgi:hypothetical protein